jgi:hypothetical protein
MKTNRLVTGELYNHGDPAIAEVALTTVKTLNPNVAILKTKAPPLRLQAIEADAAKIAGSATRT